MCSGSIGSMKKIRVKSRYTDLPEPFLNQSPFLLGGTLDQHLTSVELEVIEIKESLYVDVVLSGGSTVDEVRSLKESAIKIFDRAHFKLHKWHSNENSFYIYSHGKSEPG